MLPEGETYLGLVRQIIDELYDRGIYVIIDFHQDIAHEIYNGDGFPDWALAIDPQHERPSAGDLRDTQWGLHYYDSPLTANDVLVRHTLKSFWLNGLRNDELSEEDQRIARHPRTHLEKTIGATVAFFGDHPGILGYEPFNEPHPVGISKAEFETQTLEPFYERVLNEIRQSDQDAFIFVEPRMDWTTYAPSTPDTFTIFTLSEMSAFTHTPETFLPLSGPPWDNERVVFSFHYYDPWLLTPIFAKNMHDKVAEWPPTFAIMQDAAASRGAIPFLTEFGCSHDWQDDTDLRPVIYQRRVVRACMDLQFQQVEANLLNETYWNFDLFNTTSDKDNWNLENFSLLGPGRAPRELDIVERPFPIRSSAMPTLLSFDLESRQAVMMFAGEPVDAPTVIHIPRDTHYGPPNFTFEVRATSPWIEWDEENRLLFWDPGDGPGPHQIIISPTGGFRATALSPASRELLPQSTVATFGPPRLAVNVNEVAFGDVSVGTETTRASGVEVLNRGQGRLCIASVEVQDVVGPGTFRVSGWSEENACISSRGYVLPLDVTFAPTGEGDVSGQLRITASNFTGVTIPLSGRGVSAAPT